MEFDLIFKIVMGIIALGFIYVIGRIAFALITGKGKEEVLSGKTRPRGQGANLDQIHRNHTDF